MGNCYTQPLFGCIVCDNTCLSYEESLTRLTKLKEQANNNNAEACFHLARFYLNGLHAYAERWIIDPNNQVNALFYAQRGANQHHVGCLALVKEIEQLQEEQAKQQIAIANAQQQIALNTRAKFELNAQVNKN